MYLNDFDYELPEKLIASHPLKRGESRLMLLSREDHTIKHKTFNDLPNSISYPNIIVRNITRVVKTRIFANRKTGSKIEILILNPFIKGNEFEALIKRGGRLNIKEELIIDRSIIKIIKRENEVFFISIRTDMKISEFFEKYGHVPLPPYIKRDDEDRDKDDYQTIYSKTNGSSAAPTAGLHFSNDIINDMEKRGTVFLDILLHVGLGTFEPVKEENIKDHKMHNEYFEIDGDAAEILNNAKKKDIPIIAIGTTCLRVLETVYKNGKFSSGMGMTNIFVYPPMKIESVNMLITNFHLPKSTLIMLISAFAGIDFIKQAYSEAIKKEYRFFSYGDSMLIR